MENLREFYITPLFLETLTRRARDWSPEFIKTQIKYFNQTIADYPEVNEILENELHRRRLNKLSRLARKSSSDELKELQKKYGDNPDCSQIIAAEQEIRSGAAHLTDPSGET